MIWNNTLLTASKIIKSLFYHLLTCFFVLYILLLTIVFVFVLPLILLVSILTGKRRLDDATRLFIYSYSAFIVKVSWPVLRIDRVGAANIPKDSPCVVVVNHRSTVDVFLGSLFTTCNTTIFVRSWPFRLWVANRIMRMAMYVDIEDTPFSDFIKGLGRDLYEHGVSFLFFPEGHRSRNGTLQNFHSGAFLTATEYDIPVVPVCLTGTEKFLPMNRFMIQPAKVKITILPPVYPSSFPVEKRALKLRRFVEFRFKEYLNE